MWLFSQACDNCSSVLHAFLCLQMFSYVHHGVPIVAAFIASAYLGEGVVALKKGNQSTFSFKLYSYEKEGMIRPCV